MTNSDCQWSTDIHYINMSISPMLNILWIKNHKPRGKTNILLLINDLLLWPLKHSINDHVFHVCIEGVLWWMWISFNLTTRFWVFLEGLEFPDTADFTVMYWWLQLTVCAFCSTTQSLHTACHKSTSTQRHTHTYKVHLIQCYDTVRFQSPRQAAFL